MSSKRVYTSVFIIAVILLLTSLQTIQAQNVPVLTAPVNGSIWDSTTPLLRFWIVSASSVDYHIQISTDPNDFNSPGVLKLDVTTNSGAAGSYLVQAGTGLFVGITYYWRVGANGAYSAVSNFTPSTGTQPTYYTISVTQPVNGVINYTPNQTSVLEGTVVQFTAVPDNGCYLDSWTGDASGTTNPLSMTINSDCNLSAAIQQTTPADLLISPLNNSTGLDQDLTFNWNSYLDAASYQFILSESATLIPTVEDNTQAAGSSDPLDIDVSGLNSRTTYYWRVIVALNAGGTVNSPIWSLTTGGALQLSKPNITAPANAGSDVPLNPTTITWSAVTGAESYDLQVSDLTDFSNLIVDLSGLTTLSSDVSGLSANTQYFTRVKANSSIAPDSEWSDLVSFTTVEVPGTFNLLLPLNSATPHHPAHQVYFEWEAAANADEYQLVVSNTTAIPFIQLDTTVSGTEYTGVLTANNSYSFTVTALNSAGNTPASNGPNAFETAGIYYVDFTTGLDDPATTGTELDPFQTPSAPINNGWVPSGSVLMVKSGVYPGVGLSAPFTLIGYGNTKPMIEGFIINSSNVIVDNFIVTGDGGMSFAYGVTVGPHMTPPNKYENVILRNLETPQSSHNMGLSDLVMGLLIIDLDGGVISDCEIYSCQNGIYMSNSENVNISNTMCSLNSWGIWIQNSENLLLEDISVIENLTNGIFLDYVRNSQFTEISSGNDLSSSHPHAQHAGLLAYVSSNLTFTDCSFTYNSSWGCTILGSDAYNSAPVDASVNIVFEGNTNISNNNWPAIQSGGGLYLYTSNDYSYVSGVTIKGNYISENNFDKHIEIKNGVSDLDITGAVFKNDPTSSTDGLYIYNDGIVAANPDNITVHSSSFEGFNGYCLELDNVNIDVDARNNIFLDAASISDIEQNLIYDYADDPGLGDIITDGSSIDISPLIEIEDVTGYIGASYLMDVDFNPKSQAFLSVEGVFTFDADELEYVGFLNDGLMNDNLWTQFDIVDNTSGSNGSIEFHGWGMTPITTPGKLFTLNMKVKSTADELNSPQSLSADPNDYEALTILGMNTYPFVITGGQISYSATSQPVQSKGDVDLNGLVNMDDFNILLLYVYGNTSAITDPQALDNADYNDDGIININDATELYAFINGYPPPLSSAAAGSMSISEVRFILDNNSLVIPLKLNDVIDLTSFEVFFNYDPDVLQYQAFKCELDSDEYYALGSESYPGEAKYTFHCRKSTRESFDPGDLILRIVSEDIPEDSKITTRYRLNGQNSVEGAVINLTDGTITTTKEEESVPIEFYLSQNYPNPFNPTTTINYSLPELQQGYTSTQQEVSLVVYDVLGREVATLIDQPHSPGHYTVQFSAGNLVSGVYFYRLKYGRLVLSKKLLLLK